MFIPDPVLFTQVSKAFLLALAGSGICSALAHLCWSSDWVSVVVRVRIAATALCLPLAAAIGGSHLRAWWATTALFFVLAEWCGGLLLAPHVVRSSDQPLIVWLRQAYLVPWVLAIGMTGLIWHFLPAMVPVPAALLGTMAGTAPLVYRQHQPADWLPTTWFEIALGLGVLLIVAVALGSGA